MEKILSAIGYINDLPVQRRRWTFSLRECKCIYNSISSSLHVFNGVWIHVCSGMDAVSSLAVFHVGLKLCLAAKNPCLEA